MKRFVALLYLITLPISSFANSSNGKVDKDIYECIKFLHENGMNKTRPQSFYNGSANMQTTVLDTSLDEENPSISVVNLSGGKGVTVYHGGRKYELRDNHCNVERLNDEDWFDEVLKKAAGHEQESAFAGGVTPFERMSPEEKKEAVEFRRKCSKVYSRLFGKALEPLPSQGGPARNNTNAGTE